MQYRKIGELEVSALGLGCFGMSGGYGTTDETEALATIRLALERGVNLLDTGDMYGQGHNERLVGRAIHGWRPQVVLATKFGAVIGPDGHMIGTDGRPENVFRSCDASLRRLGVDVIDIYYQHRVDPGTPIEETIGAMSQLVEQGKVRHIGLSEASSATIRRAHAVHRLAALETEYSLWWREPENELIPVCRELGITYVAYSPLVRGLLTGQIRRPQDIAPDDFRKNHPRFMGGNLKRNLELVDRVVDLARSKACTPAQLALAWVLGRGQDVIPIPGTSRRQHLEENLGALELTLTETERTKLEGVVPSEMVAGERYPQSNLKLIDQ